MKHTIPVLLLTLTVCGCSPQPDQQTRALMDGKALFDSYCAECHNRDGQGKFLKGIPPNKYTEKTMEEVILLIRNGSDPTSKHPMPALPFISDEEAGRIAAYLLHTLHSKE